MTLIEFDRKTAQLKLWSVIDFRSICICEEDFRNFDTQAGYVCFVSDFMYIHRPAMCTYICYFYYSFILMYMNVLLTSYDRSIEKENSNFSFYKDLKTDHFFSSNPILYVKHVHSHSVEFFYIWGGVSFRGEMF